MEIGLSSAEWSVIQLSLKVGFWATLFSLPLGFWLAYILARKTFFGKALLDGLVHLPLVLPPVVIGYLLLIAFGRHGPFGSVLKAVFDTSILFQWTGAAVAAAVMGMPLMVRAMRLSIEAIDRRLETAARSLGGSRSYVFFTITLPLALPGVFAGALLSFAKSMGEFGATITFVSNIPGQTQTLPIAIYSLLQTPGGDAQVFRLSLISIIISMAALVCSEALSRRFIRKHQVTYEL